MKRRAGVDPESKGSPRHSVIVILVTAASFSLAPVSVPAQILNVTPGETVVGEVVIGGKPDQASFVTYTFEAADDVMAVSLDLEAAADLDLYLDTGYIDDYQDVLAASTGFAGTESLRLDLSSSPELIGDRYYVDVTYGRVDPPISSSGEPLRRVPFTLSVNAWRQRIDRELEPGVIVSDNIDPRRSGPYRSFRIDVPGEAPALRVDLASDATDLDLRVRQGLPMRTTREADFSAVSWAGHETIIVGTGEGSIPAGEYFIDVFDQAWLDWPADFRLVASLGTDPPSGLIDLPILENAPGLRGAVNSTVEILHADGGGTGILLSTAGHILTNYHVVEQAVEAESWTTASPMIGLTVEPTQGSAVRMLASIVRYDRDLDIALLKAESDLYGAPLPSNYRFPPISIGDPGETALGDDLYVLGYPDAGSLGTRVSITLTRGILSGFERRGRSLLFKSDADIASGNSGGPVLNSRYQLIGVATEAISEELGNSQIGYIWPLWLVPDDWWRIMGLPAPSAGG